MGGLAFGRNNMIMIREGKTGGYSEELIPKEKKNNCFPRFD